MTVTRRTLHSSRSPYAISRTLTMSFVGISTTEVVLSPSILEKLSVCGRST